MEKLSGFSLFINKIIDSKYGLILILLTFLIILGLFIADDFGLSWDEYKDITYGDAALKAYQGLDNFMWSGLNRRYYGPAYWMLVNLITKVTSMLGIQVNEVVVWKLMCFLTFQIAVFFFYILCTKFMKRKMAFVTTVFFTAQPVLFGHAFINQKDIPFMAFFLMSIVVGVIGVDHLSDRIDLLSKSHASNDRSWVDVWKSRLDIWKGLRKTRKVFLIILLVTFVLLFFELLIFKAVFLPWTEKLLFQAYEGTAIEPLNWMFARIAQDAYKTPVDMYLEKLHNVYNIGSVLVVISFIILLSILWRVIFVKQYRKFSIRGWLSDHSILLLAGAVLGLTISIRVAAPLAGALVSVYFLSKSSRRSFTALILYWLVAAIIAYATWPYLWDSPVDRFRESVGIAASFTQRETLFGGEIIPSTNMPWYSLPFLMIIKFTEPYVILFLVGVIASFHHIWKRRREWFLLTLILSWLGLPILAVIVFRIPIYDNFRQFFFLIPLATLVSGLGVTFMFKRINSKIIKAILLIAILAPGLIGIVRLHPYEYIYYNTFIGSVDHAYGHYELDYWCTSLRESILFLNNSAPPNSSIVILGPTTAAIPFAREDLKISNKNIYGDELDYVITCRYAIWEDDAFSDFEVVYEVRRDNAVLGQVKANKK